MGVKLPIYLPRVAILVLVALAATAGLTFAAGGEVPASTPAASPAVIQKASTIVVPDIRNQAFVFAKGQLQDLGFAWKVHGGVRGYAANMVVGQSPAPGTKVLDNGAPLITLTLVRNGKYPQQGTPEDSSPYSGTPLKLANAPKLPAATTRTTPAAAAKPKPKPAPAPAAAPAKRTPDFVVPGARKEPLDEMPLPARAAALGKWLDDHPTKTTANVEHWLFQNAWIAAGARMGWWHGAEALRTLIAVDTRAQRLWGIGGKSEALARRALAEVEARKQ